MSTRKLDVLLFDIEVSPAVSFTWNATPKYLPEYMFIEQQYVICWSAQWLNGGPVISDRVTPQEAATGDDSRVVSSLIELMNQADLVAGHNAKNFDAKWVRGQAWLRGLEVPRDVQVIDTLALAKRSFRLPHNSLDALLKRKLGTEKHHTNFSWWSDIYFSAKAEDWEKCEKAISRMSRYCANDVRQNVKLLRSMKPYVRGLPRLVDSNDPVCPTCGGKNLTKNGKRYTKAFTKQEWLCKDCGRFCSTNVHDGSNTNPMRAV